MLERVNPTFHFQSGRLLPLNGRSPRKFQIHYGGINPTIDVGEKRSIVYSHSPVKISCCSMIREPGAYTVSISFDTYRDGY